MAEPLDVIGTAEPVSFEDFVAASSARLFAVALLQCEHQPAAAEELLQDVLARACRRWRRMSRSAEPEARVRQMLVSSASRRGRPQARSRIEEPGHTLGAPKAAGTPPAGLMDAIRYRHRRYQRRRLGAGCVLAAAVLALAVALVTQGSQGSRASLTRKGASAHVPTAKIVSCVDAWHSHEARILCARYVGPPVAPIVARPPQAPGGPAACDAEHAVRAGC